MAKNSRGSSRISFVAVLSLFAAVLSLFAAVLSLFAAGNPFSFFPPISSPRTENQKMAAKSKDSSQKSFDVVVFLFAAVISLLEAGYPFRRKAQPASPTDPPPQQQGLGRDSASVSNSKKRDDGEDGSAKKNRKKRQRDEMKEEYEKRAYGGVERASEGGKGRVVAVGEKRKTDDVLLEMVVTKESFDDESKLMRTVVVGNLPVKTKRKTILKEFKRFGEVEAVSIRSVPIVDSKAPRKAAIVKGKINDAVHSVHAYIVFKDEQSARAALSHSMTQIGGNHIHVDMARPPHKKLKGEGSLYDKERIVFVGNLPFDVKDEELYQLFCGVSPSEAVEAIRVIRVPHMSLGKCIVYILFKTRVSHAKSSNATPSKRKYPGTKMDFPRKKLAVSTSDESLTKDGKPKLKATSPSYQGLRSSKSGVVKKSRSSLHTFSHGNQKTRRARGAGQKGRKQLLKECKQENGTPENTHQNKKARRS